MVVHTHRRRFSRSGILCAAVAALSLGATSAHALVINSWIGYPGTDVWGFAGNWNNNNIPNSGDQATIYAGPVTLYSQPASIGALLVARVGTAGQVFTNGFKLNVLGPINLDGANAGLYAYTAPSGSLSVQAPTITLLNGALLQEQIAGAKVRVSSNASGTPNGTLSVDATSSVVTYGTLDTDTYLNNGLLKGGSGDSTINAATFTLAGTASNIATIDADADAMTINATTFNLHNTFTKIDASDFQSTLTLAGTPNAAAGNVGSDVYVGDSAQLNLTVGSWSFGYYSKSGAIFVPNGSVNLNGGTTLARAAKINSYATYFTSVNVTGYANMATGEFDGASSVNVASNSFLYIGSPYFRGTTSSTAITLNGPGTIRMNGDTQIGYSNASVPASVVNVSAGTVFDWDGTSESTATCSITHGELNIYASVIDVQTYFNNIPLNNFGYDGAISVAGDSKLNVAGTAWTLFGTMSLSPGALVQGQTMTVDGSSLPAGTYSMYPTGSAGVYPTIEAAMVLKANSLIYMASGSGLNLNGATTYAGGGVITAPYISPGQPYGTVIQNGNATVTGNTTLGCNTYDMDGAANTAAWTINAGVTLTQQAYSIDTPNSTSNPIHSTITLNGGTLSMQTNLGFWTLAGGTLNMNGGGFNLPFVTHDKLVLGAGATNGTVNVGANTSAYISGGLVSAANTVVGGNVINVGTSSNLYVGPFSSNAGATLTKTGPGTMIVNVPQSHAANSTISVTQGLLQLNTDAGAGGPNLSIRGNGGSVQFSSTQRLSSLLIGSGSTVSQTTPGTVLVTSLTMLGGKLDIGASDMIVHAGDLTAIRTQIQQGYNGGAWNGSTGILSTAAAATVAPKTAIGYALNNNGVGVKLFATFDGQAAALTDVIVKYTLVGDCDLSGSVDFPDLLSLAQHYGQTSGQTWNTGDFTYDGGVTFDDLLGLAQNYNKSLLVSASEQATLFNAGGAAFAADFALAQSLVPEPTSVCAMGLTAASIVRRQRRA